MKRVFLVKEGFEYKDGKYHFVPKSDNKININTTLGKKNFAPRVTKLGKVNVLSAYSKSGKNAEEVRAILNALKNRGGEVEQESYQNFINRTAIFFYRILKEYSFDIVLTIESSAGISRDLKKAILARLPYEPIIFDEGIQKNLNAVEYSIEQGKLSDSTVRSLQQNIQKQIEKYGYFKIQKIPAQFRKFIRNWLKVDEKLRDKINGANILLIDDFLTSGSTLLESSKLLEDLGANKIIAITILK